jgi:hypothetical protein
MPNGTAVTTGDIEKVCDLLRFAVENGDAIQKGLTARQ